MFISRLVPDGGSAKADGSSCVKEWEITPGLRGGTSVSAPTGQVVNLAGRKRKSVSSRNQGCVRIAGCMVRAGKTAETGMIYNCPYWKVNPAGTGHPLEAGWALIPLRFEYAAFLWKCYHRQMPTGKRLR